MQLYGALALTAAAATPVFADAIVVAGGIALAVDNLAALGAGVLSGSLKHGGGGEGDAAAAQGTATAGPAHSRLSLALHTGKDGTTAAAAASATFDAAASDEVVSSAELTAACLNLLAALCDSAEHVAAAKARGAVRAMLGAYTRHADTDDVRDAFAALVDALISEDEVGAAVRGVAAGAATLRATASGGDPILFGLVETELGTEGMAAAADSTSASATAPAPAKSSSSGSVVPALSPRGGGKSSATERETVDAVALRVTEDLCLLEAVCSSARLAGVAVGAGAVHVVSRALAFVAVIKATAPTPVGSGRALRPAGRVMDLATATGGLSLGSGDAASLSEALHAEAIARAAAVLTGLARLHLRGGDGSDPMGAGTVPGVDPIPTSVLPSLVDAGADGSGPISGATAATATSRRRTLRSALPVGADVRARIGSALFRPFVPRALVKALTHISGNYKSPGASGAHVAAMCVAVGVYALAAPAEEMEALVAAGVVEAVTAAMRAHGGRVRAIFLAAATALGGIAAAGRLPVDSHTGLLRLPAPADTVGAAAVATRGATRHVLRELANAATAAGVVVGGDARGDNGGDREASTIGGPRRGGPGGGGGAEPQRGGGGGGSSTAPAQRWGASAGGRASLCAILRLLLAVADTGNGAALLKKQGAVEALIATLNAGASGGSEDESAATVAADGVRTGGGHSGSNADSGAASTRDTVEAALRGDAFGGMLSAGFVVGAWP